MNNVKIENVREAPSTICLRFLREWISNLIREKKNSNQGVHGSSFAFKQNIEKSISISCYLK